MVFTRLLAYSFTRLLVYRSTLSPHDRRQVQPPHRAWVFVEADVEAAARGPRVAVYVARHTGIDAGIDRRAG